MTNISAPVINAQIEGLRRLSEAQAISATQILSECKRLAAHDLDEGQAASLAEIRQRATVRAGLS